MVTNKNDMLRTAKAGAAKVGAPKAETVKAEAEKAAVDKISETTKIKEITELESLLGYSFNNHMFLREAISHPSLKQIDGGKKHVDYERLEFLGDSILSFIIIELLYNKFKDLTEGDLAKIKSFLVSKEVLSEISKKISLSKFLLMTKGEENSGGRDNPNNVENAMEALIAAIYLDSNIEQTRQVINNLWQDYLHQHEHEFDIRDIDPKTTLQEWTQKHKHDSPCYDVIDRAGPPHLPHFTIRATAGRFSANGEGGSIKSAEKEAARHILDLIDKNIFE